MNNNLKNCLKALEQLGMTDTVKVTIGKNPRQATRLEFGGISKSVSALYKVDEFLNLLENNLRVNSVASSKYNDCNADSEIQELSMWNERMATYTKKNIYNYKTSNLNEILTWTCEDFGVTAQELKRFHDNWNSDKDGWKVSLNKCKNLIYKNGYYVADASLQQTCKEWLTAHELYEKYKNNIDLIIKQWVKVGGQ